MKKSVRDESGDGTVDGKWFGFANKELRLSLKLAQTRYCTSPKKSFDAKALTVRHSMDVETREHPMVFEFGRFSIFIE